ncbi:MAG: hypothetical protein JWQ49_1048 [Edaphobacter sp.]|nr:hypothetical protein [Edaphobacter sp.]
MNDAPPSVYKYLLPDRAVGLLDKVYPNWGLT